jgi:hypothetical protein
MEQGLKVILPEQAGFLVLVGLGVICYKIARESLAIRWLGIFTKPVALLIYAIVVYVGRALAFDVNVPLFFVTFGEGLAAFIDNWER